MNDLESNLLKVTKFADTRHVSKVIRSKYCNKIQEDLNKPREIGVRNYQYLLIGINVKLCILATKIQFKYKMQMILDK